MLAEETVLGGLDLRCGLVAGGECMRGASETVEIEVLDLEIDCAFIGMRFFMHVNQ